MRPPTEPVASVQGTAPEKPPVSARGARRAHPEDFRLARSPHRWRRWLLFLASLVLVALVITLESWRPWHEDGEPTEIQRVQGNAPFTLHGYELELTSFEAAPNYPGEGRRAKPAEAVPGATLVKVLFDQRQLPGSRPLAELKGAGCTIELADRAGREWGNQVSAQIAGMTEINTCTEEEDDDDPAYPPSGVRQVGVVIMVPESVRDELVVRINTAEGYVVVDPG